PWTATALPSKRRDVPGRDPERWRTGRVPRRRHGYRTRPHGHRDRRRARTVVRVDRRAASAVQRSRPAPPRCRFAAPRHPVRPRSVPRERGSDSDASGVHRVRTGGDTMSVTIKSFVEGTHRTVRPEETLARYTPLLDRMGITRIANITGLDHIGIPVY